MRWSTLRAPARWLAALGIPLLLLAIAWREANPLAGALLLTCVGPLLPLALAPYAVVLALDVLGWRRLMPSGVRRRVRWRDALAARLAGESVAQSIPWAGLGGEVACAWLLARRSAVPMEQSIGGLVVRRLLLAPSHGIVLVAAGFAALAQPALPRALAAATFVTGFLLLLLVAAGSRLAVHAALFRRLQAGLRRRPWVRLGLWGGWPSLRLADADREVGRLLSGTWRPRVAASGYFLLLFVAEAGETWLLLRLLGTSATASQVLAIEPLVSLARAVAVFAPAGLGVQDLGYLSLLQLAGIPNSAAVGLAFVLLKRTKELVWTAAGWSVLLTCGARRGAPQGPWVHRRRPPEEAGLEPGAQEDPVHRRFTEPDDADAPGRARAVGA